MDLSIKILIVDDFASMRRVMKKSLKEIGFSDITEADDGVTALMELKRKHYDLVISDWNMPEMTGLELLKRVRSDQRLKDVPFMIVTAETDKERIVAAAKAGVSNYVIKPYTSALLTEKLNKIFH